jgi:hypothetical protein
MKLPWLLSVGLSQPTLHFLPALAALSLSLSPQNVSVSDHFISLEDFEFVEMDQ